MSGEYEGVMRRCYGDEGASFVPVCQNCSRFVKADKAIRFNGRGDPEEPNATCSRCGRTSMLFEGYV